MQIAAHKNTTPLFLKLKQKIWNLCFLFHMPHCYRLIGRLIVVADSWLPFSSICVEINWLILTLNLWFSLSSYCYRFKLFWKLQVYLKIRPALRSSYVNTFGDNCGTNNVIKKPNTSIISQTNAWLLISTTTFRNCSAHSLLSKPPALSSRCHRL